MPDPSPDNPPWGDLLEGRPNVSRETFMAFERYFELLKNWQTKTNLVAPNTLSQFWTRHVADSLQCLNIFPDAQCWVDLGSGAGFPGMAIAIMNREFSDREHHLVESNQKKCAFLRVVARETGAHARIYPERIDSATKRLVENTPLQRAITARALAGLPQLLEWSAPLIQGQAVALFHKGRNYRRELEECNGLWQFDLVVHESRIEADSVLLEIRNLERRGS